ncbi:MAG: YkgJ family cysteine cluster protein [Planctomycetota bacterium]
MEEISGLPRSLKKLTERQWLLAARRVLIHRPPQFSGKTAETATRGSAGLNTISDWYRSIKQACPFLHDRLCTIYPIRPLACREHFVAGSHQVCSGEAGTGEIIEMPVRTTEVLGRLAAEIESTDIEAVMMPMVLVWHKDNLRRARRSWPAVTIVERFVEIVRQTASENSDAPRHATESAQNFLINPKTTASIRQSSE